MGKRGGVGSVFALFEPRPRKVEGSQWATFGKQNWRCGMNRSRDCRVQPELIQTPGKASVHPDSRTVVTEVESRQEVCNNLPAEWTGPENWWRWNFGLESRPRGVASPPRGGPGRGPRGVDERGGREEASGATRGAAASGADLGGSSKHSSEKLEGRSGERFRENGVRSRVNRS